MSPSTGHYMQVSWVIPRQCFPNLSWPPALHILYSLFQERREQTCGLFLKMQQSCVLVFSFYVIMKRRRNASTVDAWKCPDVFLKSRMHREVAVESKHLSFCFA